MLIEQVQFRHWVSVDPCNLEIEEKTFIDLGPIDLFYSKMSSLRHYFIAKQQRAFLNHTN